MVYVKYGNSDNDIIMKFDGKKLYSGRNEYQNNIVMNSDGPISLFLMFIMHEGPVKGLPW